MLPKIVDFIKQIGPPARAVEADTGFNHLFIMAQIALETGWLERISRDSETGENSHNLFNIKGAYNGQSVRVYTTEFLSPTGDPQDLRAVKMYDDFRKYPSYEESIKDWLRLLGTPRYRRAYEARSDLKDLARAIYECGFATDPRYVDKILQIANIIRSYEIALQAPKDDDHVHVVGAGDTLWNISKRYGVPLEEIVRRNNLRSPDHIYPGQKLVVKQRIHTVRKGETLHAIARAYNVGIDAIVNENGIVDPNRIYPGEDLVIPS